ncbi:MAG: glycosyltransferase family 2 protein, partial [Schwartzia sp.]|nr:glycosyltransferase family 2 protein [Schwartzia sp. (in: firmicutes)]
MRISACYIVKNEAARLSRSLASLSDAVDEIVVVDSGSSDDTIKIAEQYGARVFSVPWRDDFSAARNASLEKATGDWILVVDADEYFPDGMAGNIRRVVGRYGKETDLLMFLRRELDEDAGKVLLDSYVPRLLRRVEGLAYEGAIHEEPRQHGETIRRMAAVPGDELMMMHTGYSATLSRAKGERNLALLKKELESGQPRDSIYMYLAETYDGLGDADEAMKYAWLDVESGRKAFAYASRSYRILLRILAKRPDM